jgi:hypothetical protein
VGTQHVQIVAFSCQWMEHAGETQAKDLMRSVYGSSVSMVFIFVHVHAEFVTSRQMYRWKLKQF